MEIVMNETKNKEILVDLKRADTFTTRLRGLMGKTISEEEGLLIQPCNSVHTFFMKMAIDVIFLDKEDVVLHKISNMQQRSMSPLVKGAKYVIEGYPGVFDSTEVGDKIKIINNEG